jgi:hypothetical protein
MATTSANIDLPTSRVASLLAISKGLPPPLLSCDCDEDVVWVDAVDVVFFAVVWLEVVAGLSPPRPPSADWTDCDGIEEVLVVLVVISDWGTGIGVEVEVDVVVLKPRPPVTPAPPVGIVTETAAGWAAGVELWTVTEIVDFADVFANVGQRATTIPPSLTIPNNVFELTSTSEQEPDTLLAIASSPSTQAAEQPLLKSETVQDGIWLS